nr:replication protein [Mute swan feces associated circular virus 7]
MHIFNKKTDLTIYINRGRGLVLPPDLCAPTSVHMTVERIRNVCFTKYGDRPEFVECMKYLVYGVEKAPTTGTEHYQGYVELKNPKSFEAIKAVFNDNTIHLEKREGTARQAADYCKKDGDFQEFGEISNPGKRKNFDIVREAVKDGKGMRTIVEEATSYQAMRSAEMLLKYYEKKRDWKPKVIWIHGPAGSGKTRHVLDEHPDCYIKDTGKWFEGYDADEVVLFDDYRSTDFSFNYFLRLLDRYPARVETKGGSRQFLAKTIYVTTPYHPEYYVPYDEPKQQLLRRIDQIIEKSI